MGNRGLLGLFAFLCLFSFASFANEYVGELDQPLETALIPVGFDSDDSVQIMVTGRFANTCFQIGTFYTLVDRKKKVVELQLTAYEFKGCGLDVEVPFYQVIPLGLLREPGDYKVVDLTTKKSLGTLRIKGAEAEAEGTDEFAYAPLLDAFLLERRSGKKYLVLTGVFSDSCLAFQNVEVNYQSDVVVVLPKIHRPRSRGCIKGEFPFKREELLRADLPKKFLLHVRAWGGQAINKTIVR